MEKPFITNRRGSRGAVNATTHPLGWVAATAQPRGKNNRTWIEEMPADGRHG